MSKELISNVSQGFITGDDTTTPPRKETDDDSTRIGDILSLWLSGVGDSPTQAAAAGKDIGYHLLSQCLNKGAYPSSLLSTITAIQEFYLFLSRDLQEYNDKPVEERNKEKMGPILRAVLGDYKMGRELPGSYKMDRVAHQLLAMLVGACEEITGSLEKAERTGV